MKGPHIVGIDEVGRGALAGPVIVVAALLTCPVARIIEGARRQGLPALRDSKKLTPRQRESWDAYLRAHPGFAFASARINARGIERMNISRAANLAARRCCERLMRDAGLREGDMRIFLDGGLYLGSRAMSAHATTMPKADETIPAVAMASIIAKVMRDSFMVRLAKRYPPYGFEAHKGYGTLRHRKAIGDCGPSPVHRLTFLGQRGTI